MTNVGISRKLKQVVKVALLSAAFFTMGSVTSSGNVRADDNSPIIYNGTKPNQNQVDYSGDGSTTGSLYLTVDGIKSNYGQIDTVNKTPVSNGEQPSAESIIDKDQFSNGTHELTLHYQLTNNTDKPQLYYHTLMLPRNWKNNQSSSDKDQVPDVVAAQKPTIKAPSTGVFLAVITYYMDGGTAIDADQLDSYLQTNGADAINKLSSIFFSINVPAGRSIDISIPLKVTNLSKVNLSQRNSTFTISDQDSATDKSHPTYNLSTRFAKKIDVNSYFGVGKDYLVATRNGQYKYTMVDQNIQQLFPKIAYPGNGELTFDDFATGEGATDPYLYSGARFYLNTSKIKTVDGQPIGQALQDNGYTLPVGLSVYRWDASLTTPDDHSDPTDAIHQLNKGNYGGIIFQPVKVIGADDVQLDYGATWDPLAHVTVWDPTKWDQDTVLTNAQLEAKDYGFNVSGQTVDTTKPGTYRVTYSLYSNPANPSTKITKSINVTVKQPAPSPSPNGGNGGTNVTPNTNGNSSSTNGNSSVVSNPTSSPSGTTATTKEPAVPSYVAKKGAAVYATKGIYMYQNANFKKSQRIAQYQKAKRVNRPMFVVTGYAYSKGGALRYKVRDVNHGTKTDKKRGYITANKKYVVKVYYSTLPKNKKITVINKKGVNAYKNANLTKKVKNFKKGTHLTVKKLVKHNLTTRYQLSNGEYITANKKLIIQGNR
ncbi:hypothetical protein YK48G_21830 [Lentilactobacillus fungorum]|uniref:DUF5776 domain-containing protein n=1 Tax=Lentilactobacillus fungorum TaxID=2201250 RepID=A0ABQ3W162_9LACO|nr:DUF5776 domain-containing protein [Lentilactobacillus fungorum]GHP14758.1 hypothetical protein YK48G_21830 [Lentilactobacillus fungorum]